MYKTGLVLISDRDLRITDNPALYNAFKECENVILLFVFNQFTKTNGAASKLWLEKALEAFCADLAEFGQKLVVRNGFTHEILPEFAFDSLYFNEIYEPDYYAYQQKLIQQFPSVHTYLATTLFKPWTIKTGQGTHYKVFTPFWKECLANGTAIQTPLPRPKITPACHNYPLGKISDLNLTPDKNWARKILKHWDISEQAGLERLENFLMHHLKGYKEGRNFPENPNNTSRLSPYIRFGMVSVAYIFQRTLEVINANTGLELDGRHFLFEIGWREFAYYLFWHFPRLESDNFNPIFDNFDWQDANEGSNANLLDLWKKGLTGYEMVDAGMRELWETGWMHNRTRMVVGSFLVKDLLFYWKVGEEWFWDCLVDADRAVNNASWQWVAGTGADAAPYFRIFNPNLQRERFDPNGIYVNKWLPDLQTLTYPQPILDHQKAKDLAMFFYKKISKNS
jgi:deoxyribodipyrimidine photo-lyase